MTSANDNDLPETPGGLPPEHVDDRPVVGSVKPEDYPATGHATDKEDRADSE